jgi:diguanylate cyclase (GGDEF)-like protein/putative nucleotidyltransferase with HDIG domain
MKIEMNTSIKKYKNSSLIKRSILIVILAILLFAINSFVYRFVINKFTEVEIVELHADLNRFTEKESQIFDSYKVRLLDYAEWDDTYEYVSGNYDEFVEDNFWWDYLENSLSINFVMVTDIDANILYYGAHDNDVGEIELSNFQSVDPQFKETLISKINTPNPYIFLKTEEGLFVIFANEVTDNFRILEPNGYMFFGLRMDDVILQDISHQIGNSVSIVSTQIPDEVAEYFNTADHNQDYQIIEIDVIKTYIKIDSTSEESQFYLIEWDRTIYSTALSSARFLQTMVISSVVIIVLISLTIAYISFRNSITLKKITYFDHLTGVFNRRYYEIILEDLGNYLDYPVIIVISDINGLKIMNDAFGHDKGDESIKKAADYLSKSLMSKGFIARLGGDEFASVFSGDVADAEQYIDTVQKMTEQVSIEGIKLSLSYGFSLIGNKDVVIHDVTRKAEDIMYRQKLLEIPSMRSNAIDAILTTLYEKDTRSEEHSRRVSLYASEIASILQLNGEDKVSVTTAGLVHDIGKIIITTDILKKIGVLTTDEYESIKSHPEIGYRILNSTSQLREVSKIVLAHHERWDGSGYPQNLVGEDIPYLSRILSIADSLDAMISKRDYNKMYSLPEAFDELERCAGTQFDPQLVKIIIEHKDTLIKHIESINTKS